MELKPTVRRRGELKGGNKKRGRFGTGTVELSQLGNTFRLEFKNFEFQNEDEATVGLFLSEKKGKNLLKDLDDYGERQKLDEGIESEEGRGNWLIGLYDPEFYGETSEWCQEIDSTLWPNVKPLDLKSICFAKHEDWKPRTTDPVIFCYANLEQTKDEKRKTKKEIQEKKRELEEAQQKILQCMTWEKGQSLERITQIVKPKLKYYDKDNSGDIDFEEFKNITENLGLYLNEAHLLNLFRKCDLDNSGALDLDELPFALYINDMIEPKPYVSPLYTFQLFDCDGSGELNEHEFYEALQSMCISTMSRKETSELFRKMDTDGSGLIEYEEFKKVWLNFIDVEKELQCRKQLQNAKEAWKSSNLIRIGAKRKHRFFCEFLSNVVKEEEEEETEAIDKAFYKGLDEMKRIRLIRDEKIQRHHRQRRKEAIAAKLANSKAERKAREFKRKEEIERKRAESLEQQLRLQLKEELEQKKKKSKEEREREREEKIKAERDLRSIRGYDIIDISGQFLRQVPNKIFKGREAQEKLTHMVLLKFCDNQLECLPDQNFLFWCTNVRKLDLSNNCLESIPSEIEALESLQVLNLFNNHLFSLPKEIGSLKKLIKIHLGKNQLPVLPVEMGNLESIKTIIAYENKIRFLNPGSLQNLSCLVNLDLSLNMLEEIPDNITALQSLVSLKLSWNCLKKLSNGIGHLSSLEVLELNRNEIRRLPDSLDGLTSLEVLHVRHNELVEVPDSVSGMISILDLDLSHNKILRLSQNIGSLEVLQRLDLSHNLLKVLPKNIGHMKSLIELNLRDNKLKCIPPEIGALFSLQRINLSNNCLQGTLPSTIGALRSLTSCDLSQNQLESLPNSFGGLIALKTVNLSNNRLKEIPVSIGCLAHTKILDVSSNKLSCLPHTIGMLKALQELEVGGNMIEWLPKEIGDLTSLKRLSLMHNKLHCLPASLGVLIPKLEYFCVVHNPLDEMPKKWIDNWDDIKLRSSALWSGYTDGQAAQWTMEVSDIYTVAHKILTENEEKFKKLGMLREFLSMVKKEMSKTDAWRERYKQPLERFFFEAKRIGCAPRYDALYGEEIAERQNLLDLREQERLSRQELCKQREEDERIRLEEAYNVTRQKLIYVETKLEFENIERKKQKKIDDMNQLVKASKACYVRQESIHERVSSERMQKAQKQRMQWMQFYQQKRAEYQSNLDEVK